MFTLLRRRPLAFTSLSSLAAPRNALKVTPYRLFSTSFISFDTKIPETTDAGKNLQSNDLASRVPKFPFHKDLAPTLIPKADTPRVSENFSFRQLIERLQSAKTPELLYMAESHRLYFLACFALAFVAAYNLFDMLTWVLPTAYRAYREDMEDQQLEPMENLYTLVTRFGLVALMSAAYCFTTLFFVTFPSRLVRRIEIDSPQRLIRIVTHPLLPGKPSPVITVPLADLSIASKSKVWTGEGFYGAASKSSFFFFLWEKNRRLPWVVDRSGWFWGDARVYDVLFGKEPIAIAERGLSYDDGLKKQLLEAEKKKAELRRELGPAWRFKAAGQLMQEDIQKFSERGRKAVLGTVKDRKKLK